jgi:large subunit ribosomal protein L21
MHAIIETGGKQFRVAPGDVLRVPKLAGEPGAEIALGKVLAVFKDGGESGGEMLIGETLGEAKVNATIAGHDRGEKVLVFKFKRKKQYKRTQGHRQDYTEVRVRDIVA